MEKYLFTDATIKETAKALGISEDRVRIMHKELIECGLIKEFKIPGKKGTVIGLVIEEEEAEL